MRKILYIFCIATLLISSVSCTLNKPEISEETLTGSAQIINGYEEVEDAEVIVEDGKIIFYLVPSDEQVSQERLRELGVDFIKVFAGYTVTEDLQGPNDEFYGEIYDYYDVEIIVEGDRGAVLDKGTKDKGETKIIWEQ